MTVLDRPATRADLPGILAMWLQFDTVVRGFPDSDETDVTADWEAPGFDLERGTRVLVDDGEVIGYAVVAGSEVDATVAPSRFGQGLEERLVAWIESAAEPGTTVEHFVPVALPAFAQVLEGRDWAPTRTFWRMRIDHTPGPDGTDAREQPSWPSGIAVRGMDVHRDAQAVHALVQTAFADIGSHHERSFEEWSTSMLDPKRFEPDLCRVALDGDEIVGACLSHDMSGDYGFVRQLAVTRSQRGRGLGRALLLESFDRHATRGLPQTQLGVDAANQTGATRLYESVGMRVSEQFTRWDKRV